jgi:DNA sulfur modification protein DndD
MIFKALTLENFRVFHGTHDIELAPRKEGLLSKPIVLFGGLNGAGKTSILTGIRLALLGRKAVGVSVSKKDYHNFLIEQINAKATKSDEDANAVIKLEFTHTHQGEHCVYQVERSWSSTNEEKVALYKNSQLEDSLNSEQVQSFLHELVPPGIGDLFFFDGEKIAELAEDETGSYLKEAVQKLLGIDVINRLGDDLDIYIKQINKNAGDAKTVKLITDLESDKLTLLKNAHVEREYEAQIKAQLVDLERDITKQEQTIQEKGGAWAATKNDEKKRADDLIKQKATLESQLLSELDGNFPLSLAPTAIASLISDLDKEQLAKDEFAFASKVAESIPGLESLLSNELGKDAGDITGKIKKYFDGLTDVSENSIVLDISNSDLGILKARVIDASEASNRCSLFSNQLKLAEESLESVSVNIQRAPDEEELKTLYENLRILDKQKHQLKLKYVDRLSRAKDFMSKALEIAKRLEKLYVSQKTEASLSTAIDRVDSTTNILREFSRELIQMRVKQLEKLFVDSYRKLARKEDLKLSAKIDPSTFDVTLVDSDNLAINRKSLSAGEKQIFAFAILEALGKLSGKVLPVVIDTPLGRLDSKHRDKLVRHYFPEASEQVILLSTDTEVDEDFFNAIEPDVSHAFEIEFDQQAQCSSVKEGYFWNNSRKVNKLEGL